MSLHIQHHLFPKVQFYDPDFTQFVLKGLVIQSDLAFLKIKTNIFKNFRLFKK